MSLTLNATCPLPARSLPIVIVGTGGIVRDAHLPAYRLAGFQVFGLCDLDVEKARTLADAFQVPRVFASLAEAIDQAPADAVYDVAVPGSALSALLPSLPDRAAVLMQKPMGVDLEDARKIVRICREKKLTAAVNFQLRYAPPILAVRDLFDRGLLGELHDIHMQVTLHTPWELFPFLVREKRVEILYHSIHYLDLFRSFAGDPRGVYARCLRHRRHPQLADVKSTLILDYGEYLRAALSINHAHEGGPTHQESYFKLEGEKGIAKITLGLCMDYPRGRPDHFEYCLFAEDRDPVWQRARIEGTWMPHAFIGTMASLMRKVEDPSRPLPTGVEDALKTMACVEAAYQSSARGATPVSYDLTRE